MMRSLSPKLNQESLTMLSAEDMGENATDTMAREGLNRDIGHTAQHSGEMDIMNSTQGIVYTAQ